MKKRFPGLAAKPVLVFLAGREGLRAWLVHKGRPAPAPAPDWESLNPKNVRKVILIAGRSLYRTKFLELPRLKKKMVDRAIRTNAPGWSPYPDPRVLYSVRPMESKLLAVVALFREADFERMVEPITARGFKVDQMVLETVCYGRFFEGKTDVLGLIRQSAGVEMIHVRDGIRESRFIASAQWGPEAIDLFLKSIGPTGREIAEIISIGSGEGPAYFFSGQYPQTHVPTADVFASIFEGTDRLAGLLKRQAPRSLDVWLRRLEFPVLRKAAVVLAGGLLLVLFAPLVRDLLSAGRLGSDLDALKARAQGLDAKQARILRLAEQVEGLRAQTGPAVSQVQLLLLLQSYFPEGTFVLGYSYAGGKVLLTAVSPSSSELIARLNQAREFANVSLKSPIEKDAATNRDRVTLELEVRS